MPCGLANAPMPHAPMCRPSRSKTITGGSFRWKTYTRSFESVATALVLPNAWPAGSCAQFSISRYVYLPEPTVAMSASWTPRSPTSGSLERMGSPERRDHLVREQSQALALQRGWDHPARVRLEQDAVDAELGLQVLQPLDQLRRRAERNLLLEDLVVREVRHALRLEAPPLGGSGAGASHR